MSNVTKADFAKSLLYKFAGQLSTQDSKEFVDSLLDEVNTALVSGKNVKLSGLGTFKLRRKGPRPGRNPRTKVEVTIKGRTVVNFTPSQKLRANINHDPAVAKR